MSKNALDQIISAFRAGAAELSGRTGETVSQIADSVSRVLEEAGSEGSKVKKSLARNWSTFEAPRRSRTVPLVLGILALGAATAYFVGRSGNASTRG